MSEHELDRIADQLESINEELADLAMSALRDALEDGGTKRPDIERRITRARRSVEKATHLLRASDDG
ncbi:MAG: hypothetical protein AAGA99_20360 [Actinomycetota bacterium]